LKNWREYLDFEIENGSPERVIVLFERCMIACALYEEFWLKYAKYLEPHTMDGTRSVYKRVCTIHLPSKPSVHLAWAAFEEKCGDYDKASDILQQLEKTVPDYLPIMLRRVNLERRRGNNAAATDLYQSYMKSYAHAPLGVHFAIKYARFCYKILGDYKKATEVLEKMLETQPDNGKLYLQLVDVHYQQNPVNEAEITKIMDRAIEVLEDTEQKVLFAQRKVEFLEEFGSAIQTLQEAHEECNKLRTTYPEKKKRPAADTGAGDPGHGGSKRQRREHGSTHGHQSRHQQQPQQPPQPHQPYVANTAAQPVPVYPPPAQDQQPQPQYNYSAQNNWQNYQGYGYQPQQQSWPGYNQSYYGH
jgi:pre-mRNA-processing factor 39